ISLPQVFLKTFWRYASKKRTKNDYGLYERVGAYMVKTYEYEMRAWLKLMSLRLMRNSEKTTLLNIYKSNYLRNKGLCIHKHGYKGDIIKTLIYV
ncbi:unnamed protein product, partial [Dovyalis caffra]